MLRLGIRQKLLLTFTSIVLVGGLAFFLIAGGQLESAVLANFQRDLLSRTVQIGTALPETMENVREGEGSPAALQNILIRASAIDPQTTYTILTADLRVIASTAEPRPTLNVQVSTTEEIRQAASGQSFAIVRPDENGAPVAFAAAPIFYEQTLAGMVWARSSLDAAYTEVRQNWANLTRVALPLLLFTIVASLWLGQSLARPIQELNRSAGRIAEGAFDQRVDVRSNDEIGQLAETFNGMAERIKTLLTAQRSFVSNAAHELRTPLASARLRVEGLQSGSLTLDQQKAYIDEIAVEINQMSGLITQLLALARLDEGRHNDHSILDDTASFLQDAIRRWRIQAQQTGLTFLGELADDLPRVAISANDLLIVLDNLIGNALKYTPAGGSITFRAAAEANSVKLAVEDTGEGFSPEDGERLFERFFRVDRSRNRQVPGTGLGLSIAKAILEHYGGTITATSPGPGQGATFTIMLPLARGNTEPPSPVIDHRW